MLRSGIRFGFVSDGMRELYEHRYGARGAVIIHGVHPSLAHPASPREEGKGGHVLGFAGSLHCKREWNAFVNAVSTWNGTRPDEITVRFIGRFPRFGAHQAPFVELLGMMSMGNTVDALSKSHGAYVPYWFSDRDAAVAKTAFPSKISAYVAAGVPVFYHGPAESTPANFLRAVPASGCPATPWMASVSATYWDLCSR